MEMMMHPNGIGTTCNTSITVSANGTNGTGNGEDLVSLEAEITELQRENARVESEMLRLKSNINAMETQLHHGERVCTIRLLKT
jgi:hypothetical protein